jgi:hypothetical protein
MNPTPPTPTNHWKGNSQSAFIREFREVVERAKEKGWIRFPGQPLIPESHKSKPTAEWKRNQQEATP